MRIALGLAYAGSAYKGWQRQSHAHSVQGCLEQALSRVADHSVLTHCAGRTDAGVHALMQVVHFETTAQRPEKAWVLGTNTHLPPDIRVVWAQPVSDDFHARFSATARSYIYYIYNDAVMSPIYHQRMSWHYQPLNATLMHAAAQHLLGEQDFSTFRAAGCQSKSAHRCVTDVSVNAHDKVIAVQISANAFLYHMVRNIVGTLMQVGSGELSEVRFKHLISLRDRTKAGKTAPPDGLYLSNVNYPPKFSLPTNPVQIPY